MTTKHKEGGARGGNQYGSYQVRFASPKQINFIKKLLERKQHDLTVDLETLNVQGATELIAKLLLQPDKQGFVQYASEKQIKFAESLSLKKQKGIELLNFFLETNKAESLSKLDVATISRLINALKAQEDKQAQITEVGAYLYEGVVYSIRKNQYGRFVAWTFNPEIKKYERNYPATQKTLPLIEDSHRLTLEQAVKYSAHTGLCVHCGRTLTLLKSVASGMGAWCAKKYR